LNHPNIAAMYGLEESGGLAALVMELVAGDDLSQIALGAIPIAAIHHSVIVVGEGVKRLRSRSG
jgi:serine/threonine protein kinase